MRPRHTCFVVLADWSDHSGAAEVVGVYEQEDAAKHAAELCERGHPTMQIRIEKSELELSGSNYVD